MNTLNHSSYNDEDPSRQNLVSSTLPLSNESGNAWIEGMKAEEEALAIALASGHPNFVDSRDNENNSSMTHMPQAPANESSVDNISLSTFTPFSSDPSTPSDPNSIVRLIKPLPKRELRSPFPHAVRATKPLPKKSLRSRVPDSDNIVNPLPSFDHPQSHPEDTATQAGHIDVLEHATPPTIPDAVRVVKPLPKRLSKARRLSDTGTHHPLVVEGSTTPSSLTCTPLDHDMGGSKNWTFIVTTQTSYLSSDQNAGHSNVELQAEGLPTSLAPPPPPPIRAINNGIECLFDNTLPYAANPMARTLDIDNHSSFPSTSSPTALAEPSTYLPLSWSTNTRNCSQANLPSQSSNESDDYNSLINRFSTGPVTWIDDQPDPITTPQPAVPLQTRQPHQMRSTDDGASSTPILPVDESPAGNVASSFLDQQLVIVDPTLKATNNVESINKVLQSDNVSDTPQTLDPSINNATLNMNNSNNVQPLDNTPLSELNSVLNQTTSMVDWNYQPAVEQSFDIERYDSDPTYYLGDTPASTSISVSVGNHQPPASQAPDDYSTWNEIDTSLLESIMQRLMDGIAEQSTAVVTDSVEAPTAHGTLSEQADPWQAVGQILGLQNTDPSKILEEVMKESTEMNESETSLETRLAVTVNRNGTNDTLSTGTGQHPHTSRPVGMEDTAVAPIVIATTEFSSDSNSNFVDNHQTCRDRPAVSPTYEPGQSTSASDVAVGGPANDMDYTSEQGVIITSSVLRADTPRQPVPPRSPLTPFTRTTVEPMHDPLEGIELGTYMCVDYDVPEKQWSPQWEDIQQVLNMDDDPMDLADDEGLCNLTRFTPRSESPQVDDIIMGYANFISTDFDIEMDDTTSEVVYYERCPPTPMAYSDDSVSFPRQEEELIIAVNSPPQWSTDPPTLDTAVATTFVAGKIQQEVVESISLQSQTIGIQDSSTSMDISPPNPQFIAALVKDIAAAYFASTDFEAQVTAAVQTIATQLVSTANKQSMEDVHEIPESQVHLRTPFTTDFGSTDRNTVKKIAPSEDVDSRSTRSPDYGARSNNQSGSNPNRYRGQSMAMVKHTTLRARLPPNGGESKDIPPPFPHPPSEGSSRTTSKPKSKNLRTSATGSRTKRSVRYAVDSDTANMGLALGTEAAGDRRQLRAPSTSHIDLSTPATLQPDQGAESWSFWGSLWGVLFLFLFSCHIRSLF